MKKKTRNKIFLLLWALCAPVLLHGAPPVNHTVVMQYNDAIRALYQDGVAYATEERGTPDYARAYFCYSTLINMLRNSDTDLYYEVVLRAAFLLAHGGYGLTRNLARAVDYLQEFVQFNTSNNGAMDAQAYLLLADLYAELGQVDLAADYYVVVIELALDANDQTIDSMADRAQERLVDMTRNHPEFTAALVNINERYIVSTEDSRGA